MMLKHLHKLLLVLYLVCYTGMAYSQELQFEKFTTANGLPADRVYTLHMDKKGYIWACTNYGIAKYNGNTFVPVCTNTSFKEHFAYCMFENDKGELWFANSRDNIYQIKNDSAFKVEGFEETLKDLHAKTSDINDIIVDDSQNILIATRYHSYKLIQKDSHKVVNLNGSYINDSIDFIIIQRGQHSLLVKNYPGWPSDHKFFTYKIVKENSISKKRSLEIKNKNVVRLTEQFNNDFYLTAGNELIKINPDGSARNTTFQHFILTISSDKEGNIWVGLDQEGLYKISPEGTILEHYFPETSINSILFDDQSGLWVSTAGQGIFHCKSIYDYSFLNYPGLMESVGMAKKIDSILFIGTFGGDLFKIKQNGIPEQIDLQGITKTMIGDIIPAQGRYYVAGKDAVLKADHSFKNLKKILNTENKPAAGLSLEYNNKGELFLLTRTNLYKIVNDQSIDMGRIPSKAYDFISYKDGLLIATTNGMYVFLNDSIFIPAYLKSFEDILITELQRSQNGDIWICTVGHGLFRLQPDNKITAYPDMPADVLHDVFFLNDTTIGLCLNNGVFITPLRKIVDTKDWYQLHNEESSTPVVFNNRLYLTTNAGLLSFSLENLKKKNNSKLYFKKAFTGDSTYMNVPLIFRHDQEKIEFYFDLLDYKTNKARLYYELEGNIKENGTVEGTKITLNKLSPGSYKLSVYSAISILQPKENGVMINFVIQPAFWQTTWFLILMFISGLFFLVFMMYIINLRTKNKERQKAKVTRLLAEYKLTALKAQINPHFISNSLSAIQQLILDDKTDKAAQYLAKFSLLIRYVLKYSDKAIVKLSEELEVIDLNIQLETLRFKDDFEIQKIIDKDINPENISVPPLITQPFIENAIWHGLLPLEGKRKPKLTIRISKIDADILICIEDNGVGRNSEKKTQRESQGTQLISNRLENINLLLGTKTAMLKIEDLYDEKRESIGTRVNIILPSKLNNSEYDED